MARQDEKFQIGETVPFRFEVYDNDPDSANFEELRTPDTSAVIEIFRADGTTSVEGPTSVLPALSVGVLRFDWDTTGDAEEQHCAQLTTVDQGRTTIVTKAVILEAAL